MCGKAFIYSRENCFEKDLAGNNSRLSLQPALKKRGCSLKAATMKGEKKSEFFKIKFAGLNNTLIFAARSIKTGVH